MKINKTILLVALTAIAIPVSAIMQRKVSEQSAISLAQEAQISDEIMNLAKEVQENLNAVISARKALNLTPTQLAPFKTAVVSLYENNASLKNLVAQAREVINNPSKSKSGYSAKDHSFNDQVSAALGIILDANAEARLYYATPAGVSGFLEPVPAHYATSAPRI